MFLKKVTFCRLEVQNQCSPDLIESSFASTALMSPVAYGSRFKSLLPHEIWIIFLSDFYKYSSTYYYGVSICPETLLMCSCPCVRIVYLCLRIVYLSSPNFSNIFLLHDRLHPCTTTATIFRTRARRWGGTVRTKFKVVRQKQRANFKLALSVSNLPTQVRITKVFLVTNKLAVQ